MRILNLRDADKKYRKFSLPGFRSGSIIKKIIAFLYYFFVLILLINSISETVSYDFIHTSDVVLAVIVELLIFFILLAPVIAIGFSDYYDWHGIKLFLIIMVSWCALFTIASYVSTFFSEDFIGSNELISETESINESGAESTELDSDLINDNIGKSE